MAVKSANINVMQGAARKAARRLVRDFNEVENLQASRRGPADFVAKAGRGAGQRLAEELHRARPAFGLQLADGAAQQGEDPQRRWIIEPVGGSANFLHGIPHFAMSIALEEAGRLTAAVVYQPVSDELFWAERGTGAYLNDRRLRVAARTTLDAAVVGTNLPADAGGDAPVPVAELAAVAMHSAGVRQLGATALDLAYLAAGRFDAFWQNAPRPWSIAAGVVLVREAGGLVSRTDGNEDVLGGGSILASNNTLHGRMLRLLRDARTAGA